MAAAIIFGAGVVVGTIGSAHAAQTVDATCALSVESYSYSYQRTVTVDASAPSSVPPGSSFSISVPGAQQTLPTSSPHPQFATGYGDVAVLYEIVGGSIVPGSATMTSRGTIKGISVPSEVTVLGNFVIARVPGPIPSGAFIGPSFTVSVAAGAHGETVEIKAAQSTESPWS